MNENEWLASSDPVAMLTFLRNHGSDRKLRLFACACCRRVWSHIRDPRSRQALITAEAFADDPTRVTNLEEIRAQALRAAEECCPQQGFRWGAYFALVDRAIEAALNAQHETVEGIRERHGEQRAQMERPLQADLLRDIFGHLWRSPEENDIPHRCRLRAIIDRADGIYRERAFYSEMRDLASALRAEGCSDTAILAHCEQSRDHTRGCWVIDLLLRRG